jgi:parallel beta-helix repeat protein
MTIDLCYDRTFITTLVLSLVLIGSNLIPITPSAAAQSNTVGCIQYDAQQKLIHISCKSIHLTDIYQNLKYDNILRLENPNPNNVRQVKEGPSNDKVWILDAGIVIERNGGLIIDSSDTSWLKIVPTFTKQSSQVVPVIEQSDTDADTKYSNVKAITNASGIDNRDISSNDSKTRPVLLVNKNNGNSPNGIHVHGSLKIDSVKITSWDPEKKDVIRFGYGKRAGEEHTKSNYDTAEPRPFIRVSKDATGTTNITNSELAFLGYSCSRCSGLSYYGGDGSLIKGNDIHHLLKGFYSNGMGKMVIEENKFHDNYLYGIDPHTGTHDMIIRNNKVHDNNASAIICSKHCYNILIEGNEIYNNIQRGIAFSINTTNSTAHNNYVHDESTCIGSNRASDHNKIYNNRLSDCETGIDLGDASNNILDHNNIKNVNHGIVIENVTNNIEKNRIANANNGIVFIVAPSRNSNVTDVDYVPIDSSSFNYENILTYVSKNNLFSNTTNPTLVKTLFVNNTAKTPQLDQKNNTLMIENFTEDSK